MNRAEEDYIKIIFELELRSDSIEHVSNNLLTNYFRHTPQTVNEMIKKLVKKDLVDYVPYKGSSLTEDGRKIASSLIRKHRLWERFLVDKLAYGWDEVHEEAEKLEHATSDRLADALFHFLGEPKKCPHGNNIPQADQMLMRSKYSNLRDSQENQVYIVKRVLDNNALLKYLNQQNIYLDAEIRILQIDNISENIIIESGEQKVAIGFNIAKNVDVIKKDN